MKSITINGTIRKVLGKKSTKELRKQDLVPCVLYGEVEPTHFTAKELDLSKLVYTPNAHTVKIILEKKELNAMRKLGNDGDINAQFKMWTFYVNNKGVSKAEAWTWLKQAAGNNHPEANFSLGLLYYYGYIVPEERKRGITLITKSSELGFKLATLFLKIKES